MRTNRMIRVAAPGLPPRPKLMFDAAKRRAIVFARHPTWQSYERAILLTEVVVWIGTGLFGWFAWPYMPPVHWILRAYLLLFAVGIPVTIAAPFIRLSLRAFFARQLFATRTVFWFTPEAIAFRSRLYGKPVAVWRQWHFLPVRVRFILQPDRDAMTYAHSVAPSRKMPMQHLHEAQVLEMVLTTVDRQREANLGGQDAILRSIPITEINSRLATKFTMVYAAAAALTAPIQSTVASETGRGADIDAT